MEFLTDSPTLQVATMNPSGMWFYLLLFGLFAAAVGTKGRVRWVLLALGLTGIGAFFSYGHPNCWGHDRLCNLSARQKAIVSAMKSGLRTIASHQDQYKLDHGAFADSLTQLGIDPSARYDDMAVNLTGTPNGYQLIGSHRDQDIVCVVYMGSNPVHPATNPGELQCRRKN